jgi:hypothetical protein
MKKVIFFVIALLIFVVDSSYSQKVRLNGYALYNFDDDIATTDGINYFNGTIKGGLLWGFGLEYDITKSHGVELYYFREDTDVPANYYTGTNYTQTFKMAANYILIGNVSYLNMRNSRIEPFGGGMIGMAIIENKEPLVGAPTSTTKFAWGLKAGLNIMASKRVGLKLQAQLLSAVQSTGGGLYVGTGGTGAGMSTYSSMLQFGLGGGITIKLGK